MTSIVLDTNVLISGTFWMGNSSKIIHLIEERKIKLIISYEILKEYHEVMNLDEIKQKVKHHHERSQAVQKLLQIATIVNPTKKVSAIKEDPDDDKFIEAALEGKVKYIISKDNHLLKLKKFNEIKIVNPEDFLKEIKT